MISIRQTFVTRVLLSPILLSMLLPICALHCPARAEATKLLKLDEEQPQLRRLPIKTWPENGEIQLTGPLLASSRFGSKATKTRRHWNSASIEMHLS